jgi:hypothetical protein
VKNIKIVESFKSESDVNECTPYSLFIEGSIGFLVCHYFLIKIAIIQELHNNAEW